MKTEYKRHVSVNSWFSNQCLDAMGHVEISDIMSLSLESNSQPIRSWFFVPASLSLSEKVRNNSAFVSGRAFLMFSSCTYLTLNYNLEIWSKIFLKCAPFWGWKLPFLGGGRGPPNSHDPWKELHGEDITSPRSCELVSLAISFKNKNCL